MIRNDSMKCMQQGQELQSFFQVSMAWIMITIFWTTPLISPTAGVQRKIKKGNLYR